MAGPFRGVDRYVGPGAYSREEEAFGGVPIPANVRNATFIGKGTTVLSVKNQLLSRSPATGKDSLSKSGVREVTTAGSSVDVENFQQLIRFYETSSLLGGGTLLNKITITEGTDSLVEETYEFEVVTVGSSGTGQYRIKTVSTGAITVVLTADSTYGNSTLLPGVVFKVSDTLGTAVGDKVEVKIRTDFQDGDFKLLQDGTFDELDWGLFSGSTEFSGSIGVPVKIDVTGAATVATLARNTSLPTLAASQIPHKDWNPITLDDATYTATAVSGSTYTISKLKDGVSTSVRALDAVAGTFATVFSNATTYIFDGISLNMSVSTITIDGIRFVVKSALFAAPTNGVSENGLVSQILTIPRENSTTNSETYKIRVNRSDTEGLGTYVIIPQSSNVMSNEILTSRSVSTTLLAGLFFRLASTTLKTLSGSNLALNSSFVDGPESAPLNWSLGGGATIDTTVAAIPYGSRTVKLTETTALTGATGNLFQFPEVTVATAVTLSMNVLTTGVLTGGLTGSISWLRVDNTIAGTTNITVNTAGTTSWARITLTLTSGTIPVGAVKGTLNLFNTDVTETIWVNSIQLETGGSATAYRESDIGIVKTSTREVPDSPILVLEKGEVSPSYSTVDTGIDISLLSSQSTIKDDWFIKVTGTNSFEVLQKSTGIVQTGAVAVAYTGTLIPGVLLQVPNSFSATDLNDILHVRTLARFNKTKTIDPVNYYVSYDYDRDPGDYYLEKTFFQNQEVIKEFGPANEVNSLSLAATLAFQNGASMVRLIQMDDTNDWTRAYDRLERFETNYICPLTTMSTVSDGDGSSSPTQQQYLNTVQILLEGLQHSQKMSSILQKKERTIWGSNLRGRDVDGMIFDAQNLNSDRTVYVGPTSALKEFTDSATLDKFDLELDGCFIAAACLGLRLGQPDVAVSLTRKNITGFKRLASGFLSEVEKDLLGGNGVFLLNDTGALQKVRHAVTTNPSNALKQEQSVRDIADYISKTTRDGLDTLFIGRKLLTNAVTDIKQATKEILEGAKSSNIITAISDLSVNRDELEPRTVNVRFKISPVFPINWILIEFSLTR